MHNYKLRIFTDFTAYWFLFECRTDRFKEEFSTKYYAIFKRITIALLI